MTDWSRASDGELLRHIQHGEGEALAEFYQRFAPALRGFFARRVQDQDVLDDLVQETMVGAVRAVMRFRGESQVFTWLCGIARHKLIDYYGAAKGRPEELPADLPAEDGAAERLCDTALIQAALAKLPQEYRHAMELRYLEEMPVAEIARSMKRTLKAVESILVRARKLFARAYDEMAGEVRSIG